MRISTTLPLTQTGVPDIAMARHLEDLGYDAVGMADFIVGDGTPSFDATLVLAGAATVTEKIGLEFGVLSLPLRPTAWVATQMQTLQHLSGNRVVLGVGIGGFPGSPFWRAVGAPLHGRGRWTDAALQALPGLIRGEPTRLGDQEITLGPAASVPPILIGGNSEAAMRRAVLYGDGWVPSLVSPATLAKKGIRLREIAHELDRAVPSISVGGHAVLVDNPAAVESFTRVLVEIHRMSPEEAAAVPVTGSPAQVAEHLHAYSEAGVDMVGLSLDGGDWMRQAEALAEARAQLSHAGKAAAPPHLA